jgi:hypothetical protein
LQRRDSVACVSGVMECRTSWRLRPSAPGTDTTTPVNVGARGTTSLWGRCFRAAADSDSCECRRWGLNPHRCCHPRDFEEYPPPFRNSRGRRKLRSWRNLGRALLGLSAPVEPEKCTETVQKPSNFPRFVLPRKL